MKLVAEAELVLVVDLVDAGEVERLPEAGATARLARRRRAPLRLAPFEALRPHQAGVGAGTCKPQMSAGSFAGASFPLPARGA